MYTLLFVLSLAILVGIVNWVLDENILDHFRTEVEGRIVLSGLILIIGVIGWIVFGDTLIGAKKPEVEKVPFRPRMPT